MATSGPARRLSPSSLPVFLPASSGSRSLSTSLPPLSCRAHFLLFFSLFVPLCLKGRGVGAQIRKMLAFGVARKGNEKQFKSARKERKGAKKKKLLSSAMNGPPPCASCCKAERNPLQTIGSPQTPQFNVDEAQARTGRHGEVPHLSTEKYPEYPATLVGKGLGYSAPSDVICLPSRMSLALSLALVPCAVELKNNKRLANSTLET